MFVFSDKETFLVKTYFLVTSPDQSSLYIQRLSLILFPLISKMLITCIPLFKQIKQSTYCAGLNLIVRTEIIIVIVKLTSHALFSSCDHVH